MKRTWIIAAAAALAAATTAAGAATLSRDEYRATLKRIAVDHNKARAQCRLLSGQARRVCFAEANADVKKGTAAAEADFRDTPRARRNAKIAAADADYAVARVKCDDRAGDARRECLRSAKALQAEQIKDAMQQPAK